VDKLEKSYAADELKSKAPVRTALKKKAFVNKSAVSKKTPMSATEMVIKIIKRHKKGVGISKLKDKTGFDDKKIRSIVYRASKQGKIKRVGKGIYVKP
jgi:predicted transcriptional regulator of viral defense system